jgi:DNA-binding NarL/FixJ family response regulator
MEQSILEKTVDKGDDIERQEMQVGMVDDIVDRYRDSVKTLTRILETISPNVVVVPVDLPLLRGLTKEGQAKVQCPDDGTLFQAIKSGAVSYFAKESSGDGLTDVIRGIRGGVYPLNGSLPDRSRVAEQALRQLQDISSDDRAMGALIAALTPRETQTLKYVAEGYSNKQIARALYVSEQTIKNHVSAVQHKLGANNRTHAVVLALRRGCINIAERGLELESSDS